MSDGTITIEAITAALDDAYAQISGVVSRLSDPLSDTPDEGGWTIRQMLSHLIGALNRVSVHSGFYLAGQPVIPIGIGDDYWIAEWEHAPLRVFEAALATSYQGVRAFVATLDPAEFGRTATTPFGEMTFGQFLLVSVNGHIARFHGPQLAAFAPAP